MDPANNMGARLLNNVNNVGARLINRVNNAGARDPWRVGSIINSTTERINRAFNTFTWLTGPLRSWFTIRVILVVLMLVGVLSYVIYNATEGFQSGNSNQRPRKISRKSGLSGKK